MNELNDVVKEIMAHIPAQQLTVGAQAHLRTSIFCILLKHTAASKAELLKKINDLDRKLYIAEKKAEDEAVDSAGFNK